MPYESIRDRQIRVAEGEDPAKFRNETLYSAPNGTVPKSAPTLTIREKVAYAVNRAVSKKPSGKRP
jgi:hypothetical protein